MNLTPSAHASKPPLRNLYLKLYLLDKIDRIAGLKNARILYFDGMQMHTLRDQPRRYQQSVLSIVIRAVDRKNITSMSHPAPYAKQEEDSFYRELLSSALGCRAAVLSWVTFVGSHAAIPADNGTAALSIIAFGATTASSAPCGAPALRLWHESSFSDPETNRWLDSPEWYHRTVAALDAISASSPPTAMGATLKMTLQLQDSGIPASRVIKGLTRSQRQSLTEDVIRAHNPHISSRILTALAASGVYPKHFGKVELTDIVRLQLKKAIAEAFSFISGASSGLICDTQHLPDFAVAVMEELNIY